MIRIIVQFAFIFLALLQASAPTGQENEPPPRFSPKGTSFTFPATDGRVLRAMLYIPKGKGPHPVVLLLHGGSDDPGGALKSFKRYGEIFTRLGYAVLSPDYRRSALGGGELFDLLGALDYIEMHVRLDRTRVTAIGSGQGAYLAALLSTRAELLAVVASGGFYDLKKYVSENKESRSRDTRYAVDLTLIELGEPAPGSGAYERRSPAHNADDVTASVLLIHGKRDSVIHWHYSKEFADALKSAGKDVELVVLEGAGHDIDITSGEAGEHLWKFLLRLGLPVPEDFEIEPESPG